MAPTTRQATKTKVWEAVLDLVIPYIHDVDDRNSVSLVSRKFYEIDGITRKRVTVHTHYYPNPSRLSKRFPFLETLTLKGNPSDHIHGYNYDDIRITPWIEQLALQFKYLKELHIHRLVVNDEDFETLAKIRGKDLRSLKIKNCKGFSADGLKHVSKYCNQLRTFCLKYPYYFIVKDGIWLHQLALNSTVLERLHVNYTDDSYAEDLKLLAKNCCNSLLSLKIGKCYLSKLEDTFRYAVRLEHFGGGICDQESDLVAFEFPPNTPSLSRKDLSLTKHTTVLPFLNQIKKLVFVSSGWSACQYLLFKRCPNLEVLFTNYQCGDNGLQIIGKFCKKLRKLTHDGLVTNVGLIALAEGCAKLECLKVRLIDISNDTLKCLGTLLKNLRKFCMHLSRKYGTSYPPLDNGIMTVLMGCRILERLDFKHSLGCRYEGLTDVGLEYIGKYGANLRSLSLTCMGNSNAGLVKLSEGCPKLRKLKLTDCPFSEQVLTSCVFNIPSLRYVWFDTIYHPRIVLALTRPEFQNIGRSKMKRGILQQVTKHRKKGRS